MVHKVLFWGGFGLAVRFWQLGIQMRPFLSPKTLWAYPIYGGLGASFGYWLQNVEQDQMRFLSDAKTRLLEKRRRRQEREGSSNIGDEVQTQQEGIFAHKQAEA